MINYNYMKPAGMNLTKLRALSDNPEPQQLIQ